MINFMKAEEKRVKNIVLQWAAGASKQKNKRTTALQSRINTLYQSMKQAIRPACLPVPACACLPVTGTGHDCLACPCHRQARPTS